MLQLRPKAAKQIFKKKKKKQVTWLKKELQTLSFETLADLMVRPGSLFSVANYNFHLGKISPNRFQIFFFFLTYIWLHLFNMFLRFNHIFSVYQQFLSIAE